MREVRLSIKPHAPKQQWVAEQLGVSSARLSNWERGLHDPPQEIVSKAAAIYHVDESVFYDERPLASELGNPLIPVSYPTVKIRNAGVVPAGNWGDPLDSEDFIEVDAKYEARGRFAAHVAGDSCYPALLQGDLTIWQTDTNPSYGLIVLAQRRGDHACTVKQLEYCPVENRPKLVAINPASDGADDPNGWDVIARLVAVIRANDGLEQTWYLRTGLRSRHLAP